MTKKKIIIIIMSSIFGLILLTAIIVGIIVLVNMNKPVAKIEDETPPIYETDKKEITSDVKLPSNYSASDAMAYAMWRMENINFAISTTGESKASFVTQKVNAKRTVIDNEAIITTVSTSSFKKIAEEKFFSKDQRVLISKASSINDEDATAVFSKEKPNEYSKEEYLKMFGWMPFQLTGYIVSKDTYLNEPTMVKNQDDTYTISMDLNPNPNYAPYWYRYEILYNSSSTIIPDFQSIHIDFTIDNSYRVLKAEYNEVYKVEVFFKTTTKTHVIDSFTYDNISFDKERYDFYKSNLK